MKYQIAHVFPTSYSDSDAITGWTTRHLDGYLFHTEAWARHVARKLYAEWSMELGDGDDLFVVEAGSFKRVWWNVDGAPSSAPVEQRLYEFDMPF